MIEDTGRPLPLVDLFGRRLDLHELAWQSPHEIEVGLDGGTDDPNLEMEHAVRPLHLASISPRPKAPEGVATLLAGGADPDLDDGLGAPPGFWAARRREARSLAELMVRTAEPATRPDNWSREGCPLVCDRTGR